MGQITPGQPGAQVEGLHCKYQTWKSVWSWLSTRGQNCTRCTQLNVQCTKSYTCKIYTCVTCVRFRWKGSIGRIEYKIILAMFSLVCFILIIIKVCFFYPLYLNTLYLHWEWALSTRPTMSFTVSKVDKLNTFWIFMTTEATTGSLSVWKGGWGEGYLAATCTRNQVYHFKGPKCCILRSVGLHLINKNSRKNLWHNKVILYLTKSSFYSFHKAYLLYSHTICTGDDETGD